MPVKYQATNQTREKSWPTFMKNTPASSMAKAAVQASSTRGIWRMKELNPVCE